MNLISTTINSEFHINESRDSETDTHFTALVTYGSGSDHGHVMLSIEECREMRDFLDKLITKSDKHGGVDPL